MAPPSSEARFLSKRQFVNFAGPGRTTAESLVGDAVVRLRLVPEDSLHRVRRSLKKGDGVTFALVVGGEGHSCGVRTRGNECAHA